MSHVLCSGSLRPRERLGTANSYSLIYIEVSIQVLLFTFGPRVALLVIIGTSGLFKQ